MARSRARTAMREAGQHHQREVEATYPYCDASGQVAFEVVRFVFKQVDGSYVTDARGKRKKTFSQRRPSGESDQSWLWGLDAGEFMRPAPGKDWIRFNATKFDQYPPPGSGSFSTPPRRWFPISFPICSRRSPPAQTICIAEGEKKVDLIRSFGFPATCCAGGANKWSSEHSAFLQGADVVLLPDNDPVGREHVMAIAESLAPAPGGYVSSNYLTCRRRATSSTGTRRAARRKSSPASSQPLRITCPMRPRDRSR